VRILHVNKFLYRRGGAEAYLLDLAELQRRAGHEVAYFGMRHPRNPTYAFQDTFPEHVDLDPPPRNGRARVRTAGRMIYSRTARRGMERILRAFRPDVVHLHNIYHQLSPSVLSPIAASGTRAVMTLHDFKLACPSYLLLDHGHACTACVGGSLMNPVRRRCKDDSLMASALLALESATHRVIGAYGAVETFLCPSRFCADIMTRAGIYPDRMRVLPNFVSIADMPVKSGPGSGAIYVGRLSAEKGVGDLIEAVSRLPGVPLDIVGEGPLEHGLRREARVRADGRVRFHGHLPHTEVLRRLRESAFAVVPSRGHENQPMSVLEAFGCGTPVVATDRGGLPELVASGRYGTLVPAGDPTALADAIKDLLGDPDRTFLMGKDARVLVEERFSPAAHLDELDRVYAGSTSR
jgi:glycosyltransferase involved in cell wall biosynthesis